MTSLAVISLDLIQPHPRNVRRDATPDDELVASIRAQGILQPLGVVPTDKADAYLLIAGHRRYAAARAADLTTVPVVVLEHLDTETKQLEAMLVENGRRQDLTAMEEATAYEQLTLLGSDVDAIADATGRAKSTVRSRLKLTGLSTKAQDALHGHEITIEQADQMTALAEYPKLLKEVEKSVGTNEFHWRIRQANDTRHTIIKHAKLREEYSALGLPEIKMPKGGWNYGSGPYPARDADEADAWYPGDDRGDWTSAPTLVIRKRTERSKSKAELEREAKWKRDQEKQREAARQRTLADQLRAEHIVAMAPGLKVTNKDLLAFLQAGTARMVADAGTSGIDAIVAASGVKLERAKNDYHGDVIAGQVLELSGTQLLKVFLAAIAHAAVGHLYLGYGPGTDDAKSNAAAYWAAFEASGYALPDVDLARRGELEPKDDAA